MPDGEATKFESALRALVARERIEVILPWTDRDALALSAWGDHHYEGAALVCPRRSLVELAGDKWATNVGLRELGVPVPAARVVTTGAGLRRAAGELGYPARSLVLKPRSLSGARGVWSLRADADAFAAGPLPQANVEAMAVLVDACRAHRTDSFILQEEVSGEDVSVDVLAAAGTVEMAVARTRTATLGGLCIEGVVRPPTEAERAVVTRIVAGLGWSSLANVQLRVGDAGPVVYEINARASGSIGISALAGVDLLAAAIDQARGVTPVVAAASEAVRIEFRRHWQEQCWRAGGEELWGRQEGWCPWTSTAFASS
ncbi:MAG TPA: ATP-grasp domain-containing protein [Jiangellaceae bacterium]|nr:ATP-grasp domain-containing protein [Jiangellaceae bacterium]